MTEKNEVLSVDRLTSGDRPSVYVAGMVVAHALKKTNIVVLAVDALGRVVMVPPSSVELKSPIRIPDSDLHDLPEDEAISVMVKEGRVEDEILQYLSRRQEAKHGG